MRSRILTSFVCTAVVALVTALGAGSAAAAPTDAPSPRAADTVTIGQTCVGTFGGTFHFSINATGDVPAGATWTMTAQSFGWPSYLTMGGTSDSTLVQVEPQGNRSTRFTAPVGIPAGTVVLVRPNAVYVPAQGATSVTLTGPGGSRTATWRAGQGPCSG